jgi:hypothetical protein
MLYACIMDKRNPFHLVLLQDNPFFYCLVQFWVHLLVSQIPTGGSREVARESVNTIHFHLMLYTCIMDKRNHFYLVLLQENNPFFYYLDRILVHLLVKPDTNWWLQRGRKGVHKYYSLSSHALYMYYGQEELIVTYLCFKGTLYSIV